MPLPFSRSPLNRFLTSVTWFRVVTPVVFSTVLFSTLMACQVPVFRYSLERWNPDQYRFLVLTDGEPDEHSRVALKVLSSTSEPSGESGDATVAIHDVRTADDPFLRRLWKQYGKSTERLVVTLYPQQSSIPADQVASVGILSQERAEQIVDSPVRREIVRRLAEGHSAVWILLESGDMAKDRRAFQAIENQLAADAELLKLPTPEEMEVEPQRLAAARIKLKIQFSIVTVSRDDPQESFLVDCLLNSEEDLQEFQEPLAFPVFGRGRVLYALVGDGITAENIRRASAFIVGPCSCQVKEQNPGFDLLLQCNWNSIVGTTLISDPIPKDTEKPTLLRIPAGRTKR
jgi:hypothetical protein